MNRVMVTGGRHFSDRKSVEDVLDTETSRGMTHLIVGDCQTGADRHARSWWERFGQIRGVELEEFKAPWAKMGRAAGPHRNQMMVTFGEPDVCIAFFAGNGDHRGTRDAVRRAQACDVPIVTYREGYDE